MPIGEDPLANFSYFVEIQGKTVAQFKNCEGVSIKIGVIEHRENKMTGLPILKKIPGHVSFSDITLKRGKINDKIFWDWIKEVQEGNIDAARKEGSVILYDFVHGEVGRYNFFGAWPSTVELGGLDASADEVLLETVILTLEKLEAA